MALAWPCGATSIPTGSDLEIRWDNTIKYSDGWRVHAQDGYLLSNPNQDDGDRDFARGLISNRIDLLSEFDLKYHDFGLNASAAAWYDTVYNGREDNDSPATFNPVSVPNYHFPRDTRKINGRDAELLNAFIYGKESFGSTTFSFRAGRHTLLWARASSFQTTASHTARRHWTSSSC